MATTDEIAELRELINEPDDSNGWTDERLAAIIDGQETMNGAAKRVWVIKATTLSTLVDVSESGSSRKLSDMHKQALSLADYFGNLDGGDLPVSDDVMVATRLRRGFS